MITKTEFKIIYLEMYKIINGGNIINISRSILSCEYFLELTAIQLNNENCFMLLVNSYKIKDIIIDTVEKLKDFMMNIENYKTYFYAINKNIKCLNLETVKEELRSSEHEKFIDYI